MSDFGKVLEEWERIGGEKSRRGPAAEAAAGTSRGAGEAGGDDGEEPVRHLSRGRIEALPVEAVLDLHGMTAASAEESLRSFFRDAAARGLGKVLVIHGKGNHSGDEPVLGKTVSRFLESCPFAGRHGFADRKSGGRGAVWVVVRKKNQRSR